MSPAFVNIKYPKNAKQHTVFVFLFSEEKNRFQTVNGVVFLDLSIPFMFLLSSMIDHEVNQSLLLFLELRKQKIKIGELLRNLIRRDCLSTIAYPV